MLVYGLCFIGGSVFVFLAAVGGLDGVDFADDVGFDLDGQVEIDDIDVGTQLDQTLTALRSRWWLPFLSLRFWTFALCFFGLTGLLLTRTQPALASGLVALIAVCMGLLCGLMAALVLRSLGRSPVSSLIRPDELAGQLGTVEIPFDTHSRGKVSLSRGGSTVSFLAVTQEERAFGAGETVLVVGLERNQLWVASTDGLQTYDELQT
ncbi:MAG TPA: hypothetical protein VEZ50_07560 [Nodosilinea sp.]|nr:hypothetical protein [Nodosilinea sp.]